MARKKEEPILTYVEMLVRTAKSLQSEINEWEAQTDGSEEGKKTVALVTDPLYRKLEAAKEIYRIETGSEW